MISALSMTWSLSVFWHKVKWIRQGNKTRHVSVQKRHRGNTEAINMLRAGIQTPVKLTFNNARKIEGLASKLTFPLQIDSADIAPLLMSDSVAQAYGLTANTFICMFLPNTYEVYWTASPKDILDRMKKEYDRYWNDTRIAQAAALGLTPTEASTLASIVDAETNKMDEAPTIAGVYLNRLKKGYKLQADPTLVFAIGDFPFAEFSTKTRISNRPITPTSIGDYPPARSTCRLLRLWRRF